MRRLVRFNVQNLAFYCLWIDLHIRNRTCWTVHRDHVVVLRGLARPRTRFDYRKLLLVVFRWQYRLWLTTWYIWGHRASFWSQFPDCNLACISWLLTSIAQLAVSLLWRMVPTCHGALSHSSASVSSGIVGGRILRPLIQRKVRCR